MDLDLAYLVTLTPDETEGGFVVTFQDVPEAITQGEDFADALAQASDALEEAIAGRIRRGDPIPELSALSDGTYVILRASRASRKDLGGGEADAPVAGDI
jgi:antitoxin HicB